MVAKAETKPTNGVAPKAAWKPRIRFVEFRGRKFTVKLVDEDNGFPAATVVMTINGPAANTHAHSITIDKDGYMAKTEAEEKALLKLANRPIHRGAGGSLLVTWENREMPEDQRKAEMSAVDYKRQLEDLSAQIADKPALEEENRSQAAMIENLQRQLAANKGG